MQRIMPEQFKALLVNQTPLLDVRASVEFEKGAFPGSQNFPLLNDDERRQVGVTYKQRGKNAAIELGHQLVCGDTKEHRIRAWLEFLQSHPEAVLYCFRGGLRSNIAAQWIRESGVEVPVVEGGYKALRRFLLTQIENQSGGRFRLLSGMTGTGKTGIIHQLKRAIDLEGLANHRGSSFGRNISPQPSQVNFENRLAIELIKSEALSEIILEDESRLIGRCYIPEPIQAVMKNAPIVLVEEPFEARVDRVFNEYIVKLSSQYRQSYNNWIEPFRDHLLQGAIKMRKRLGNEAFIEISQRIKEAVKVQQNTGDPTSHRDWIEQILMRYYDPMYRYQLGKKEARIQFRGSHKEVADYFGVESCSD